MHDKIHNIVFYCFVALIEILLFYLYKTVNEDILKILLYPHARLTEIYYNISLIYMTGIGYSSTNSAFAIGRACMGGNFIIMMFGMTSCLFSKYFKGTSKVTWLITSFTASVIIGILVSCIRIIGSVPFVAHPKFALFHSSIGISLYFFALTGSYAILKKIFRGDLSEKSV
jgi:exosortase K